MSILLFGVTLIALTGCGQSVPSDQLLRTEFDNYLTKSWGKSTARFETEEFNVIKAVSQDNIASVRVEGIVRCTKEWYPKSLSSRDQYFSNNIRKITQLGARTKISIRWKFRWDDLDEKWKIIKIEDTDHEWLGIAS